MAHHKSTKKRIRQDKVRRLRNRSYMSSVRTSIKKLRKAVELVESKNLDVKELSTLFISAQSHIMKAVSKKRLDKNNGSRRIKRLALLAKKAQLNASK